MKNKIDYICKEQFFQAQIVSRWILYPEKSHGMVLYQMK